MRRFEITQERVTEVCLRFVSDFRGSSLITPPGQLRQRRSKYSPRRSALAFRLTERAKDHSTSQIARSTLDVVRYPIRIESKFGGMLLANAPDFFND
jgi:hypothetical protein